MGNLSAGDLGLPLLVGIVAVGFADIVGAHASGQHRDAAMDHWDTDHGFGAPASKAPKRPLKHARRVLKRTYTSRAIARVARGGPC
jgi:hypothetical protein